MTKQLIINADDFGRTRGVSTGIIRAHLEGIVTSTTAMMNMPGVANDLLKAKAEAPKLGLGVHLTFTAGRPLLPTEWVSSLIDEHGKFLSQEAIIANPTHIDVEELKSEIKSQIKTFKNATGQMPDHLDVHHFVHVIPHLFAAYLDLADEFKLPVRIPFPRDKAALATFDQSPRLIGDVPPDVVKTLVQADWELLAVHSIRSTNRCFLNFYGDTVSIDGLLKILAEMPDGISEIMTHPGIADDKLKSESTYNVQREKELAVLTDPKVKARIQELGIELTTFGALIS
jgi:chitin disaccharide deacetylase